MNVLSDAPLRVKPPPSAVVSLGLATLPSSIFLSATSTVVLLTVVVVPLTVRSPLTVSPPVTATPVNSWQVLLKNYVLAELDDLKM